MIWLFALPILLCLLLIDLMVCLLCFILVGLIIIDCVDNQWPFSLVFAKRLLA